MMRNWNKRRLNLYYSVVTSENSTLQELKHRQTFVQNEDYFFKRVSDIAGRCNLPGPEETQQFSKYEWKSTIKRSVRDYLTNRLQEEAGDKSTLARYHIPAFHLGKTHPVWDTVQSCRMDVVGAVTNIRMLTGTYLLHSVCREYLS